MSNSIFDQVTGAAGLAGTLAQDAAAMQNPNTTLAQKIAIYQQLLAMQGGQGLPPGFEGGVQSLIGPLIDALKTDFSNINVTMPSASSGGDQSVALLDSNGNPVTLLDLIQNPNATYHWSCPGTGNQNTSYFTAGTDNRTQSGMNPQTPSSNSTGVSSNDSSSGCTVSTTFSATGSVLLGQATSNPLFNSISNSAFAGSDAAFANMFK